MNRMIRIPQSTLTNADIDFCKEIVSLSHWLFRQTHNPEDLKNARKRILQIRDKYYCNLGNGCPNGSAQRVSLYILEIVNFNPEDWNKGRRTQRLRHLKRYLRCFEMARIRRLQKERKVTDKRGNDAHNPRNILGLSSTARANKKDNVVAFPKGGAS